MTLDLSKPVQMRSGGQAIIHTTDGPDPDYPVVASVQYHGEWIVVKRTENGQHFIDGSESEFDLINVPEPVEFGIDLHENGNATVYVPATEDGRIVDKIKRLEFRYHPDRTGTDMIEVVSVEGV